MKRSPYSNIFASGCAGSVQYIVLLHCVYVGGDEGHLWKSDWSQTGLGSIEREECIFAAL